MLTAVCCSASYLSLEGLIHNPLFSVWYPLKGHTYLNKLKVCASLKWTLGTKGIKNFIQVRKNFLKNNVITEN